MKKALVSPNEQVYDYNGNLIGVRVAQVESPENTFALAEPMMWIDCDDDVIEDQFYWDGSSFIVVPVPPAPVVPEAQQVTTEVTGQGGPNVVA